MEKEFIIANEHGVHARPATMLVGVANKFESDITLTYDGVTVDLKSIMGVLSLGVKRGSLVIIRTNGPDELLAMESITKMLKEFNLR